MDDYYELLGVDVDASTDDIKTAYRDLKAGGGDAAKLNKAWNVLSDPYQRGRYDQQRAEAMERGEIDLTDDVEDAPSGNGKSRAASNRPARQPRGAPRQPLVPTIQPPAGTRYPRTRERIVAMIIDLAVLLAMFIGSQLLVVQVEQSQQKTAYDARKELVDHTIPNDQKASSDAKKASDAANKDNAPDKQAKLDAYNKAKAQEDADNKALDAANKKLSPIENAITGAFFLLSLLYLVLPSIVSGRTLGKKLQHLKVLRQDGSPLRAGDAIKRYGTIVIVTYALSIVLGPLAAAIVLFGVTMWTRNPNQQGMHDRFAKTIVVSDAE